MGAARTLRRKLRVDEARRMQPENIPAKRGTPHRGIVETFVEEMFLPYPGIWRRYEFTKHATKGWRCIRMAA